MASRDSINHFSRPVLEQIGNIAYCIAVGQQVPTASTITVVVEPGTKYEVCCNTKEQTEEIEVSKIPDFGRKSGLTLK